MDKKSEYQDQIKEISEQIVKEPDNVSFYIKRANLYEVTLIDFLFTNKKSEEEYYKKKYEEDKKKILDITPNTTQGILRKSYFCQIHNNYEKAIEGYTKLINNKKLPKNPILFYQRGICYFELHKYKEVINDLTNAMNLYINEKLIKKDIMYLSRGFSYYFLEKYSNAQSDFLKLLEENSDIFKEIRYEFAVLCYFTGKYKEALSQINTIIESDPQNYRAIFYRSLTHKKLKNINRAKKDEKIINQALKNKNEVYEDIGLIYYQHNEWDKALDCLREVKYELSKEAIEKIEKISNYYLSKGEYDKARNACKGYKDVLELSWWKLGEALHDHLQSINDKQKEFEIFQAKIDERDRIIRNQAHDIKNIISTIINPLMILKRTTKNSQIDRALKQAEVLSKMVNAVSLSYSGSEKDFYYDARHNSEGMSLKDMITSSVEASIGNIMQIVKYYKPFWEKYFPQYDLYEKALTEYTSLHEETDTKSFGLLIKFLNKYMFDIAIEFGDSDALIIGDKKGSDVKLLTLFNEIIFNAIKYAAFVKKEDRIVSIKFNSSQEFISLEVENSLSGDTEVKSVGTGNLIIDNIINIMKGEVTRPKLNNRFITKIKFPNFWEDKNNGKDIIC